MRLTKAQAIALQEAQGRMPHVVHFERQNDLGMNRLEEAGLVVEGWRMGGHDQRERSLANVVEKLSAALENARKLRPCSPDKAVEEVELDAMHVSYELRQLQLKWFYLTDEGHMMANLTRQGKFEVPANWNVE